jgi:ectoine hydroxylase-related dioxygenase (phytanoyl-CoA dioxygenase family)
VEGSFERDGAVCVRGAVSPEHLSLAREAIDENLADLSPRAKRASADGDGAFVEDFCNWQRLATMRRFIETSGVAAIAGTLMGSPVVRLYHDHVLVKEPGTRQPTPWHQDQPYYNVAGRQNASMWLPVDPVPAASTLRFVAGSHRGEWFMPRSFLDDQAKWFPEGSLAELPDVDSRPDDFRILGWALEPGDAVFFHMLTLHAAGGVPGPQRRRVLSVRFLGADMVHAPRSWPTSPEFEDLAVPAGAPMDDPRFPVLWTAPTAEEDP